MPDVLFILVLALVIFGPAKLPQLARELGRYRAEFKQMQRALMEQVEAELSNIKASDSSKDGTTSPISVNEIGTANEPI